MYYSPLTSDYLYSIETQYLRNNPSNDTLATKRAFDHVQHLGGRGGNANGFSGDSEGRVYMLMPENNAVSIFQLHRLVSCEHDGIELMVKPQIYIYNTTSLQAEPFVRDPRIIWPVSSSTIPNHLIQLF